MSGRTEDSDDAARHRELSRAFAATAAAYERGRPEYPDDALDWWDLRGAFEPGHAVLDLGAGTGKLTRILPVVCRLHAVEPLEAMRTQFAAAVPDVRVLDGTAEAIPFPDATFDTVLVAQAFHWFDQRAALTEIARVLKPGGGLGLIWNRDDAEAAPWLGEMVDEKRAASPSTIEGHRAVVPTIEEHDGFGVVEVFEHRWVHDTTLEGLLADVLSRSYVSALPMDERLAALTRAREAVERHLGAGVDQIRYPYHTIAFWSTTPEP